MAFSLDQLDATKASAEAFEFEYDDGIERFDAEGNAIGTGVFFSVLGGQSEVVTKKVNELENARRQKQAAREIQQRIGVGRKTVEINTLESDREFGQRLAAVRLVGWRGITNDFTTENALRLCQTNAEASAQIIQASDEMGNFMKI